MSDLQAKFTANAEQFDALMTEMLNENKHLRKTIDDMNMDIDQLPENLTLYKDSGAWQLTSDDAEEVLCQQHLNESFFDFIKRCPKIEYEI